MIRSTVLYCTRRRKSKREIFGDGGRVGHELLRLRVEHVLIWYSGFFTACPPAPGLAPPQLHPNRRLCLRRTTRTRA
jgi:hypothetical protein